MIVIKNFLNPVGHQNSISGSKVTATLLKGWILYIGGASAGEGLRLQPAQQACFRVFRETEKSVVESCSPCIKEVSEKWFKNLTWIWCLKSWITAKLAQGLLQVGAGHWSTLCSGDLWNQIKRSQNCIHAQMRWFLLRDSAGMSFFQKQLIKRG